MTTEYIKLINRYFDVYQDSNEDLISMDDYLSGAYKNKKLSDDLTDAEKKQMPVKKQPLRITKTINHQEDYTPEFELSSTRRYKNGYITTVNY
jgi:hypothetical protein